MPRRWTEQMSGERYLGNSSSKKEVHDLPFTTLADARADGYDPCAKCLAGSTR